MNIEHIRHINANIIDIKNIIITSQYHMKYVEKWCKVSNNVLYEYDK